MTNQPFTQLNNGNKMPLLGLGVYDMYQTIAQRAVLDALEIGYRLIDTASLYNNETEVGVAINQSSLPRNEIFLTTKVGNADHGYDETLRAHWPVKGKRKETWLALEKLYTDKRVKAIGVANYLIPFLDELAIYASIVPMLSQVEFTPWLFQKDLMKYCKKKNIQLQSYSPITRSKKFDDARLLQLCNKYDKTPAQIILQWNIAHGISTIPKSSNKVRLQENFDCLSFKLSADDVTFMDSFNENFRICDDPAEMF
jgi:diketogulonate reductase-like aldo/keto reductase